MGLFHGGAKCRLLFMLSLTTTFFLIEIIVGYITNSMALVADSFHMLSDVVALVIAYISVRMSPKKWSKNTFGWARAEVLGALINAVFLCALCFSILVESLKRFYDPEDIHQPYLILAVGVVGLVVNLIGLMLFKGHGHGHSHGGGGGHTGSSSKGDGSSSSSHTHNHHHHVPTHEEDEEDEDDDEDDINDNHHQQQQQHMASTVDTTGTTSATAKPIAETAAAAKLPTSAAADSKNKKLRPSTTTKTNTTTTNNNNNNNNKSQSHSHQSSSHSSRGQNMNMHGVFLHVMADALGSVIVIISASIIIFTNWQYSRYVDPALSLIMVGIIMRSTWPLLVESAMILLQTVPTHIQVDSLQKKLLNEIDGVLAVHEFHVWQLAGDRIIASAHIRCRNLVDYMAIAEKVKEFFHNEGIHSTTIQPEFVELSGQIPAGGGIGGGSGRNDDGSGRLHGNDDYYYNNYDDRDRDHQLREEYEAAAAAANNSCYLSCPTEQRTNCLAQTCCGLQQQQQQQQQLQTTNKSAADSGVGQQLLPPPPPPQTLVITNKAVRR
ncbi:uncharacterized protein LOC128965023 [Oppia nitens]|uniref:uncharacterized protein LOC128965023 n=1 Tax=Oppia nitens TaxID=1686743 RepID=UPI0023DB49C2|nr:uncharacterized protein LOC128965023 [Oppia nitens]